MMLAWLALALMTIGVKPQQAPPARETAARSAKPTVFAAARKVHRTVTGSLARLASDPRCASGAELAFEINSAEDGLLDEPRARNVRRTVTGSLARLASDPRCESGAELAFEINSAEDGLLDEPLALKGETLGRNRRRKAAVSWLLPCWLARGNVPSGGQASVATPADGRPGAGDRLGSSGCTAYCVHNEDLDRMIAAADGRESSPSRWLSAVLAATLCDASETLAPWFDYLASHAGGMGRESVRVSRRPGRADSIRPQEQAVPASKLAPDGKWIL